MKWGYGKGKASQGFELVVKRRISLVLRFLITLEKDNQKGGNP